VPRAVGLRSSCTKARSSLAISLRNVGSGIAVCQAWTARAGASSIYHAHAPLAVFRPQSRDRYFPVGDIGMWRGALRDPDDQLRAGLVSDIEAPRSFTVELLYSDLVGRQRTISRFALFPAEDGWIASLVRHWFLDWDGPRSEDVTMAASAMVIREHQAAAERRAASGDGPTGGEAGGST